MVSVAPRELLLALISLLILGIVSASFFTWSWVITRLLANQPILPASPIVARRETPWGIVSVVLSIAVYYFVSRLIIDGYVVMTGRFPAMPPVALPKTAVAASQVPTFSPSELMALSVVVNSALLVLLPLLLRRTCGARLRDFGISFQGWWKQAALGFGATLAAAPIVYLIQFTALKVWENHEHPLQKMLMKEFSPGTAELAILSAVIAAPLFEELFFRGIIQSWLVRLTYRRAGAIATPPVADIAAKASSDRWPVPGEDRPPDAAGPAAGEFLTGPVDARHSPEPELARSLPWIGIGATSLLFALVHGPQWPAPLGLFVLAMIIGTVYARTGSLIAAIFMHATFNGISTLMLFCGVLVSDVNESKKNQVPIIQPAAKHGSLNMDSEWMHWPIRLHAGSGGISQEFCRREVPGLLKFWWCRAQISRDRQRDYVKIGFLSPVDVFARVAKMSRVKVE
jgi:membrane protease YdiL (CAAX protease family)